MSDPTRVVPLRSVAPLPSARPSQRPSPRREPLWRHVVGDVLRRERLRQHRILREVADDAQVSMAYLSEVERGRKEASSEILAAAAHALGLSLAEVLARAHRELVDAVPAPRTLDLTTRHTLGSGVGRGAPSSSPGSVSLAA